MRTGAHACRPVQEEGVRVLRLQDPGSDDAVDSSINSRLTELGQMFVGPRIYQFMPRSRSRLGTGVAAVGNAGGVRLPQVSGEPPPSYDGQAPTWRTGTLKRELGL